MELRMTDDYPEKVVDTWNLSLRLLYGSNQNKTTRETGERHG